MMGCIALLDLTHGGAVLARWLSSIGERVVGIDVYHTLSDHERGELEDEGIPVMERLPEGCTLVVAPVHLPPISLVREAERRGIHRITHHEMVRRLALERFPEVCERCIEITGTRGKTTTSVLLARLLSCESKVVCHTTMGVDVLKGGVCTQHWKRLSITPASVLDVLKKAEQTRAEHVVLEVSLGVCGLRRGLLTTLEGEYPIAGGTLTSTHAKTMVLSHPPEGFVMAVPDENVPRARCTLKYLHDGLRVRLLDGTGSEVATAYLDGAKERLENMLDGTMYTRALARAAVGGMLCGLSPTTIEHHLPRLHLEVDGRMSVYCIGDARIVDCSGSGLRAEDITRAVELAIRRFGRVDVLVVGGSRTVCEGLDGPELESTLSWASSRVDRVIHLEGNESYEAALRRALYAAPSGVVLLCIKCFR